MFKPGLFGPYQQGGASPDEEMRRRRGLLGQPYATQQRFGPALGQKNMYGPPGSPTKPPGNPHTPIGPPPGPIGGPGLGPITPGGQPPTPGQPPMPTGPLQTGQAGWQWGSNNFTGSGGWNWVPQWSPGANAYISQQLFAGGAPASWTGQVDWNDALNSIGTLSGTPYDPAAYAGY